MKLLTYTLILISCLSCKSEQKNLTTDIKMDIEKFDVSEKVKPLKEPKLNTKCNFETYIVYKDSLPLFEKPNGKIAKYFRFEDDPEYDFGGGFLFKDSELGWLQIGKDESNPDLENFWIKSKFIRIGTTNYGNSQIKLHKGPNKNSEITGYINEESYLDVLNCNSDWVFVQKGDNKGWLAPEFICTNSETNCN